MEPVNNETIRVTLALIGPAGFGLLLYCAAISYIANLLWKELRESRKEFIAALNANADAIERLADRVNLK